MPSKSKRSIFAKPPIKVIVGSEDRVYYVHPGAFEAYPAYEAQLKESTDNHEHPVDWCAYDEQTVDCVLNFLYTGDYQAPKPAPKATEESEDAEAEDAEAEEAPAEDEEVPEEVDEGEEVEGEPSDCDPSERPLTPLGRCCGVNLPGYTTAKTPKADGQEEPATESPAGEIYLHTKVYAFAHLLDFADLKQFALNRLAKVLISLEQTKQDLFPYLANGIRLIYKTTNDEPTDDARNLLAQFVAFNYAALTGEEFDKLIAKGGEFVVDVSHKLARRLAALTSTLSKVEDLGRNEELEVESADKDEDLESLKEE